MNKTKSPCDKCRKSATCSIYCHTWHEWKRKDAECKGEELNIYKYPKDK